MIGLSMKVLQLFWKTIYMSTAFVFKFCDCFNQTKYIVQSMKCKLQMKTIKMKEEFGGLNLALLNVLSSPKIVTLA